MVHQLVYSTLIDVFLFDKKFIFIHFQADIRKVPILGISQLEKMMRESSHANGSKPCIALKLDIKRFFDSINHETLKSLLQKSIYDENLFKIINIIIDGLKQLLIKLR